MSYFLIKIVSGLKKIELWDLGASNTFLKINQSAYLSCCVYQLKMVLLSIYCDHFSKCYGQKKRHVRYNRNQE